MKLRIASALMLAGAFLFCAAICSADKITATGKSSYGDNGNGSLTPDPSSSIITINGFRVGLDDSDSGGTDSFLEIDTPNLAPGTTIDISGAGVFNGIFCSNSFLGSCDNSTNTALQLSMAQQACLNAIDAGFSFNQATDVLVIKTVSCSLTTNGNNMALIFDSDGSGTFPSLTVSSTPPTMTTPEPGSLMLLGAGLIGVWGLKRSVA